MTAKRSTRVNRKPGTLLWIGNQASPEFSEAAEFCRAHASQIAIRDRLVDAIERPATAVERIVLPKQTEIPIPTNLWSELERRYRQAKLMILEGPLLRRNSRRKIECFDATYCPWHQWRTELPLFVQPCTYQLKTVVGPVRMVAVVAQALASAEPVLDLIESAGVSAIWCRRLEPLTIRGVDLILWDDSATGRGSQFQSFLRQSEAIDSWDRLRQIWLANAPSTADYQAAIDTGFEDVIVKPFAFDALSELLANASGVSRNDSVGRAELAA